MNGVCHDKDYAGALQDGMRIEKGVRDAYDSTPELFGFVPLRIHDDA